MNAEWQTLAEHVANQVHNRVTTHAEKVRLVYQAIETSHKSPRTLPSLTVEAEFKPAPLDATGVNLDAKKGKASIR